MPAGQLWQSHGLVLPGNLPTAQKIAEKCAKYLQFR